MAFFLDRGLVVQRVSFVWRAASFGGLRDDTAAGNVASLTFTRKFLDRGLVVQRVSFVWHAASFGGLRDDTAAGNVASLTFTRKCLLRASDCGCGNRPIVLLGSGLETGHPEQGPALFIHFAMLKIVKLARLLS